MKWNKTVGHEIYSWWNKCNHKSPESCDNAITFPLYEETSVALEITRKKQRFKLQMVRPSQHQRCLEDFILRSSGVKKRKPIQNLFVIEIKHQPDQKFNWNHLEITVVWWGKWERQRYSLLSKGSIIDTV